MRKMTEKAMRQADGGTWYNVVCTSRKHGYTNISHIFLNWAKADYQAHRSHRGYDGKSGYYVYLYKDGKYYMGGKVAY